MTGIFDEFDHSGFWNDRDYSLKEYLCATPDEELIASIEKELGYKLPKSYIELMKSHNGAIPLNICFPTQEPTLWAEDHVAITGIYGIGQDKKYSLCGSFGSQFMIEKWGYPEIGICICDCPSAGQSRQRYRVIDRENCFKKNPQRDKCFFNHGIEN